MNEKKVFCIGFPKTGTKSINRALTTLGYKVKSFFGADDPDIGRNVYERAFGFAEQYDAFDDTPWCVIYKELDKKYPRSKFILTLRPTEKWIKSAVDHFGKRSVPLREWTFGVGYPKGNEDIYIARYERHNKEVLEYFKDRPDDLLVLRLTEGDGWEKLCPFLHKDIPNIAFPHENRGVDRARRKTRKIRRVIKRSFVVLAGLFLLGTILYWIWF